MTDCRHSNDVLVGILRVLERIEEKLDRQDKRFEHFEDVKIVRAESQARRSNNGKFGEHSENYENIVNTGKELEYNYHNPKSNHQISNQSLSRAASSHDASLMNKHEVSRVPYSNWSYNERCQDLEEAFTEMLEKYLGDYWRIPADNRLPLMLFHGSIQGTRDYWESQIISTYTMQNPRIGPGLDFLHHFDAKHRSQNGNDFLVVDFDLGNNTRLYRIGENAIGKELMVEHEADQAPWSRLV